MEPTKENKLEFTLERQEKPVVIAGQKYVLLELDGKERDNYLNGIGARVKHTADGKPAGLKSFDGLQASLVTACLRTDEGERSAVPVAVIQGWPARVVTRLYEAARDMNGLDTEDDKKGND